MTFDDETVTSYLGARAAVLSLRRDLKVVAVLQNGSRPNTVLMRQTTYDDLVASLSSLTRQTSRLIDVLEERGLI